MPARTLGPGPRILPAVISLKKSDYHGVGASRKFSRPGEAIPASSGGMSRGSQGESSSHCVSHYVVHHRHAPGCPDH